MPDGTYDTSGDYASQNFVVVAQAASPRLALCKQNYSNGTQKPYDNVKNFNFFEVELWNLWDLYTLSKFLLTKPRCGFIRGRIKDMDRRRNVPRLLHGEDFTLITEKCNWFALDIDGLKTQDTPGNLQLDINDVLLALYSYLGNVECFAVASASYGFKPNVSLRLFCWATEPVSNNDLKQYFKGCRILDHNLFNPIQVIYTAAPIFHGMADPIQKRIEWIGVRYPDHALTVTIPSYEESSKGSEEKLYTKRQGERIAERTYQRIIDLAPGERHNGLMGQCILLGKLVGQGIIEEAEAIDRAYGACDNWHGKRNRANDMKTIRYGIDVGKRSMENQNNG